MLKPIKRKSLTETIIGQILDFIRVKLNAGDKLPSERALMESLAVGRSSLREAMRALEVMGIVETRAGEGTFVASDNSTRFQKPLEWGVYGSDINLAAVYEARRTMETAIVPLVIEKITNDEINELLEILKKMAVLKSKKDFQDFIELDYLIHKKLSEFVRNDFLKEVMRLTNRIMKEARKDSMKTSDFVEMIGCHRNLVQAVSERDVKKAVKAMKEHFDLTKRLLRL
jgi:GntR family transcriptional repressor for pyruvate dehydrogenase complex